MGLRAKIGVGFKIVAFGILLIDGIAYGEDAVDHGSLPLPGFIYLFFGLGLYLIGEKICPENPN